MHRILPLILLLMFFILAIFQIGTVKRAFVHSNTPLVDIVFKLGIIKDNTKSCCTVEEIVKSNGEFDEKASVAIFNNQVIDYPKTSLAQNILFNQHAGQQVLGTTNATGEEKWIEVSLDQQMLRAWEGDKIVMEFPISSGKWAPTPKGTYHIWYKTRSQSMIGGSKELGTYYNLPNVPHNMFFYLGYAIHGAYWHNNFGQPMSHGCVNAPLSQVSQLFEWAGPVVPLDKNVIRASADNPGTKVFVH